MSDPTALVKEELGQGTKITYEVIFNLHLNRINELIPNLVKENLQVYELFSIYSAIRLMNSLIIAGRPRGTYKDDIKLKLDDLKITLDLKKISSLTGKDEQENKLLALYQMHDIIDFMVEQMNPLGLIPPEDVEVVIPTTITREDYVWHPAEGDLDYEQEAVSAASEGESVLGVDVAKSSP